jgi:hypothetical protein
MNQRLLASLTLFTHSLFLGTVAAYGAPAFAQKAVDAGSGSNTVYRCPNNEYTNDPTTAKAKNCAIVPPNISTVEGSYKPPQQDRKASGEGIAKGENVRSENGKPNRASSPEQKARESDRRKILEDELRSAEDKLVELKKDYNNGEPERRGDERNYSKYQERVSQIKADMSRAEADVSALKREIGNLKD